MVESQAWVTSRCVLSFSRVVSPWGIFAHGSLFAVLASNPLLQQITLSELCFHLLLVAYWRNVGESQVTVFFCSLCDDMLSIVAMFYGRVRKSHLEFGSLSHDCVVVDFWEVAWWCTLPRRLCSAVNGLDVSCWIVAICVVSSAVRSLFLRLHGWISDLVELWCLSCERMCGRRRIAFLLSLVTIMCQLRVCVFWRRIYLKADNVKYDENLLLQFETVILPLKTEPRFRSLSLWRSSSIKVSDKDGYCNDATWQRSLGTCGRAIVFQYEDCACRDYHLFWRIFPSSISV